MTKSRFWVSISYVDKWCSFVREVEIILWTQVMEEAIPEGVVIIWWEKNRTVNILNVSLNLEFKSHVTLNKSFLISSLYVFSPSENKF